MAQTITTHIAYLSCVSLHKLWLIKGVGALLTDLLLFLQENGRQSLRHSGSFSLEPAPSLGLGDRHLLYF